MDCSNPITDLTPLSALTYLTELYLSNNQITGLTPLRELKHLKTLDVRKNLIRQLPPGITSWWPGMAMKWEDSFPFDALNLYGNPLTVPPAEIVKQGKTAIKAYFDSLKEDTLPLNEVKVLLVGDGAAGKTSLVNRLLDRDFNIGEPQTHGINIKPWAIQQGHKTIKAYLWDFGGQEIMHATHQFFLSKRSLYLLVLDGRKDEKTEYWLKHIESFGGDSPVLAVINKTDENPGRDYFSIIRKTIRDINGSFEKLETKELVPLPDNDKITVEYEELTGHELEGQSEILIGKLRKKYSVSKLLNGIVSTEERIKNYPGSSEEYIKGGIHYIDKVFLNPKEVIMEGTKSVQIGDNATLIGDLIIAESIRDSVKKVSSAAAPDNLKGLPQSLAGDVEKVIEQLPKEKAEGIVNDLQSFMNEAISKKPRKQWWELSAKGIKEAAKTVGTIGLSALKNMDKIIPLLEKL